VAMQALHAVLQVAVADGALPGNPVAAISRVRGKARHDTPEARRFLSAEEVQAIAVGPPYPYDLMVRSTAWTGLPASEVAGLSPVDMHIQTPADAGEWTGFVLVRRTRRKIKGYWEISEP
jgi:hypothetical protein